MKLSDVLHHQKAYRADIDGLRAIAVLSIVGFHFWPEAVPGGFVGVDIFFVISGYVISGGIIRELGKGSFDLLGFYRRRIRRIFPALIIVLLVTLLYGWYVLLPFEFEPLGKHAFAASLFLSNFAFWREAGYFDVRSELKPLLHLWSLGVEEQFYLILPTLLLLFYRSAYSIRSVMVTLLLLSFGWEIVLARFDFSSSFYLPISRLWELLTGGLAALDEIYPVSLLGVHRVRRVVAWLKEDVAPLVGLPVLFLSVWLIDDTLPYPSFYALAPAGATYCVISGGAQNAANRLILSSRFLVFVGLISYPLYLWHWPLLTFARIVEGATISPLTKSIAAILAFFFAWIVFRFVEVPIRKQVQRTPKAVPLMLISILISVGLLGLLIKYAFIHPRSARDRDANQWSQYIENADWQKFLPLLRQSSVEELKVYTIGEANPEVAFFGDSHVGHFIPRFVKLAGETDSQTKSLAIIWKAGCAPVPGVMDRDNSCRYFVQSAKSYINDKDIKTVVISAFWTWYLVDPSIYFEGNGRNPDTKENSFEEMFNRFEGLIREFISEGRAVTIVLPTPFGEKCDPSNMIRRTYFGGFQAVRPSDLSLKEFLVSTSKVSDRLRLVAEKTGATIVDPSSSFCTAKVCPSITSDGKPIYGDGDHIHPDFAADHVFLFDRLLLNH